MSERVQKSPSTLVSGEVRPNSPACASTPPESHPALQKDRQSVYIVRSVRVLPRREYRLTLGIRELRNLRAHKSAAGVEAFRLPDWVEHAEIGHRIGSGGRAPLPAAVVRS